MARLSILLVIWLTVTTTAAQETQIERVLVLHAYHPASWTDELNRGIRAVLAERGPIEFHIEYMDTKRDQSAAYLASLQSGYAKKWRSFDFDVVITSDNNALDFALAHQYDLLDGSPIVFCGVNRFQPAMIANSPRVTGVVEQGDFQSTLEWVLAARPATERLIMITDNSATGQLNAEELSALVSKEFSSLSTESTTDLSFDELTTLLTTPDERTIAFFIGFWHDGPGWAVSPEQLQGAFEASAVPIFGRSEWMIGKGMVGGMCVSGYAQGSTAATLAARILNGEAVEAIPVVTTSPNVYMFDYHELQKHNLHQQPMPSGAIVINEPTSLLNIDRTAVYLLVVMLFALAIACVAMAAWVHALDRQRRMVRERDRVFDTSIDLMCIVDTAGRLIHVNQSWERILGWSADDLIGQPYLELIHPDDQESTVAVARRIFAGKDIVGFINHYRSRDGSYRTLSWTACRLPDSNRAFGSARDVTDEQCLQSELQQAQKLESIGRLAGGIAHDFNNLLTGIIGGTEMLVNRGGQLDNQRRANILGMIQESAKRAAELTQQLLTIGRKSQGQREMLDLNQVVTDVVSVLKASIDRKIEIVTNLAVMPLIVNAERGQLHAAVLNLGVNARDEMAGGGTVTFTSSCLTAEALADQMPDLESGQYAVLTVRDTGGGIDPKICDRIFEPFFTTKAIGAGTGLGLSAAYSAIVAHGGRIHVDPGPGEGACFTLCLPLAEGAEAVPTKPHDDLQMGTGTILIIDDEPSIRDAAGAMLERLGYTVLSEASGAKGVVCYREHQQDIDLVMLDLVMPDQSGHQIFEALNEVDSDVRVLLSSGFDLVGGQAEALMERQQIVGFLEKPFTLLRLSQIVAEALAVSR